LGRYFHLYDGVYVHPGSTLKRASKWEVPIFARSTKYFDFDPSLMRIDQMVLCCFLLFANDGKKLCFHHPLGAIGLRFASSILALCSEGFFFFGIQVNYICLFTLLRGALVFLLSVSPSFSPLYLIMPCFFLLYFLFQYMEVSLALLRFSMNGMVGDFGRWGS
jgi:hypothetical protein